MFVMFPHPMIGRVSNSAMFVGANIGELSTSQALVYPSGAAAGDLCVFYSPYAQPNTPAGWTGISPPSWPYGYQDRIAWKILTSGDISSPPTINSAHAGSYIVCHVYRFANSISLKTSTSAVGSSISMTGFTKDAAHRGVVMFVSDRDITTTTSFTGPTGFSKRAGLYTSALFTGISADVLNGVYLGGTGDASGTASAYIRYGHMLELT